MSAPTKTPRSMPPEQFAADFAAEFEAEFEEAKPCRVEHCDQEGKWAVWCKHGPYTCPEEFFLCQKHKEEIIEITLKGIRLNYLACAKCKPIQRCGGHVLNDLLRVIPL